MPLLKQLLDILFPPRCVACGAAGAWFCSACLAAVTPLPSPFCSHCGRPLGRQGICRRCQLEPTQILSITSYSAYRQPLRKAIHAFKYDGMRVLCEPLAGFLVKALEEQHITADLIVPVPLHRARIRERGYNQSALLARTLGRHSGIRVDEEALVRVKNTPPQVGLNREQRRQNMAGAFCCSHHISGQNVLLIDDVCTTGATLEACAQELAAAGAQSVQALTLARALPRRSSQPYKV